jgi:hypothetical protein
MHELLAPILYVLHREAVNAEDEKQLSNAETTARFAPWSLCGIEFTSGGVVSPSVCCAFLVGVSTPFPPRDLQLKRWGNRFDGQLVSLH